jgi:uncharacterized protein YndB with AHSA1/START domain
LEGDVMTEIDTAIARPPTQADYEAQVSFTSPPPAVFEALTTLQGVTGWWSVTAGDGSTGGELRLAFGAGAPLILHVDIAEPASLVQWTCVDYATLPDWAGTTISFDLAPASDGGCALSFRHRGLTPQLECYANCKDGWDHFLPSLRAYVDAGAGSPWASDADVARREARAVRGLAE